MVVFNKTELKKMPDRVSRAWDTIRDYRGKLDDVKIGKRKRKQSVKFKKAAKKRAEGPNPQKRARLGDVLKRF